MARIHHSSPAGTCVKGTRKQAFLILAKTNERTPPKHEGELFVETGIKSQQEVHPQNLTREPSLKEIKKKRTFHGSQWEGWDSHRRTCMLTNSGETGRQLVNEFERPERKLLLLSDC